MTGTRTKHKTLKTSLLYIQLNVQPGKLSTAVNLMEFLGMKVVKNSYEYNPHGV